LHRQILRTISGCWSSYPAVLKCQTSILARVSRWMTRR